MSEKLRILVLEDSTADVELMERELHKARLAFSTLHVQTEADFLRALKEAPPDLILADFTLPGFNGMAALALARNEHPETPFISVSGTIGEESAVELMKQGATDFVSKGRLFKLVPAIQRALREVEERAEKQRAKLAFRNSESRFRAVFEGAGTGIAVEDLQGGIVETNWALQQMLGYNAEELQQITRKDFTHARDAKADTEHYRRLVAGESDYYQVEERFVRKDGRIVWGRLTVSMIRDASGQPQFPLVMIEDITERQRAEEAHLQYAAIVESSNDAITSTTFDGIIFSWNPAAERLYGFSVREANGRSVSIIIPPDKEGEFSEILEKIKCGERIDNFETTRLRKDGARIHVSVTISPIKDASARIIGASSISRDITGRKRAEEALRESEENYRKLVELAPDAIFIQCEGKYVYLNRAGVELFGARSPEEIIGKSILEMVHPDYHGILENRILQLDLGRDVPLQEEKLIRLDGTLVDVEATAIPFVYRGKPAFQVVVRNITERKRAEIRSATFATLGQRLSSATTESEAAQIIVEVADSLLGWDSCTLNLRSADPDILIPIINIDLVNGRRVGTLGNRPLHLTASPLARKVMKEGAQMILRQEPVSFSPDLHPFGDLTRPAASLLFAPIRNAAKVIGVLTIQSYSTNAYTQDDLNTLQALADHCGGALERIRTEAENQKLAAFAQFNPNPVLELAADGRVNYFNEAALSMAKSLGKKHPSEFLPGETPAIVQECLAMGQNSLRHETIIQNRAISWSFFPVKAIGVVHCYAADITERQNLESQLRQSQKMESIGQLAGGIAHDFNNILTVIQGHTSLLVMGSTLSEDAMDSARQIGLAAERAANLTRQLLTFSRRQVIQPKNLDLNEVVNNMTKMLRRLLGEDVTLQVNYAPALPLIHADPGMMEQILLNLSVNARDAMPKGGRLFVNTSAAAIDEAYVHESPEARPGEYVCLMVKDTGVGIPPENLPRIFDPFFTTKDIGKGTGLGLATVYGIVQQHRGWIKVASEVGRETQFQIFLPSISAKAGGMEPGVSEPKVRGGNETILVVEDETPLRILVRSVLERYGYHVLEANSGVAALEVWHQHREQIHLLLTDMVMPHGLSGRELAEKLLAEKPRLKVIYSSGYSLAVVGTNMVLQEGLNFLQKPYHPRKLAQAIRDCLDG